MSLLVFESTEGLRTVRTGVLLLDRWSMHPRHDFDLPYSLVVEEGGGTMRVSAEKTFRLGRSFLWGSRDRG